MSTPTTFNRFAELPKELQIQIWDNASGTSELDQSFLHAATCDRETLFPVVAATSPSFAIKDFPRLMPAKAALLASRRLVLMSVCTASCQSVLEAWRSEVAAIVIEAPEVVMGATVDQSLNAKQEALILIAAHLE